jgi:hypothetical protein
MVLFLQANFSAPFVPEHFQSKCVESGTVQLPVLVHVLGGKVTKIDSTRSEIALYVSHQ